MRTTAKYVPTSVGPNKLDQVLAYCPELEEESKTKLCIIYDLLKLGKYLNYNELSPKMFYNLFDKSIDQLETVQNVMQAEYNTQIYRSRYQPT